jgi:GTP-binding protein
VEKEASGVYRVDAQWLKRILDGSNMDDWESLQYFQRQLESGGVLDELQKLGVKEGDTVRVGDYEFEYLF